MADGRMAWLAPQAPMMMAALLRVVVAIGNSCADGRGRDRHRVATAERRTHGGRGGSSAVARAGARVRAQRALTFPRSPIDSVDQEQAFAIG